MHRTPKITVIVPTYKRPQLLKRAIKSILSQTYTDFKVCVYDNASNDETQRIVKTIATEDKRVMYHCHEMNIGAYNNFQYGLMQVNTPFFSFLSDDDFLLPKFFETAMQGFSRHPEAAFSAASVITMTDRGKILYAPLSLWKKEGLFRPPEGLLETLGEKYPIWTGILFRKEVIGLTGGLEKEIGTGDLNFVYKIAAKSPFVISKEPAAVCVNHAKSSSAAPSLSSYWPSWLKMIENITDDKDIPQLIKNQFRTTLMSQIINELLWIGIRSFEARDFEQAEKAAKILSDELNQHTKGKIIKCLVWIGRNSRISWILATTLITYRRKFLPLINFQRKKLQQTYGHLSAHLEY